MSAVVDYAQAGELKFGQVGIANLRVRTLDVAQLAAEMRDRVQRAPNLFARAAVVLDFGGLSQVPALEQARALVDGLRAAGVLPVALAYGTKEIEALSQQLGLPLLAKFRAQYEPATQAATPAPAAVEPAPAKAVSAPAPAKPATSASPGLMQASPVRSGQQVYAENRDLTVLSQVGAGAEVIADGNIHIYGVLRGRALAGVKGDVETWIFCQSLEAELISIAGRYRISEQINLDPADRGKPMQIHLMDDRLVIDHLIR